MCEHQQRSIKHAHNNIMWLIFLCSFFPVWDSAACALPMITQKLLMVNHNGSGWALYYVAPSLSYPSLIPPLSQPMVSKVNAPCVHSQKAVDRGQSRRCCLDFSPRASTGSRALPPRCDYSRAAAGEGGTPSAFVGFSTEKYIRLADER